MIQFKKFLFPGKRVVMSALMIAVLYACVHDPFPVTAPPTEVNPGNTYGGTTPNCVYQGVCFESSVLPIFVSACAKSGCHDANTSTDYNLSTYNTIIRKGITPGNASTSKLYRVLSLSGEDQMPPAPNAQLTTAQKDSIAKWINQGAKNTVKCNCSCDTTQFTYAKTIAPIMTNYCVGCHNPASAGGNYTLNTYAGVKATVTASRLIGSITQISGYSPMPKGGKLSDCQIKQIKKWVAAGALNN
ncbi:MAG: cytochrome c [Bacteroidetes bacterium]|nr:cytochrome c [Bacteroidota bacterium]